MVPPTGRAPLGAAILRPRPEGVRAVKGGEQLVDRSAPDARKRRAHLWQRPSLPHDGGLSDAVAAHDAAHRVGQPVGTGPRVGIIAAYARAGDRLEKVPQRGVQRVDFVARGGRRGNRKAVLREVVVQPVAPLLGGNIKPRRFGHDEDARRVAHWALRHRAPRGRRLALAEHPLVRRLVVIGVADRRRSGHWRAEDDGGGVGGRRVVGWRAPGHRRVFGVVCVHSCN